MSSRCRECGEKLPENRKGHEQLCKKCREFMEMFHKRMGIKIIDEVPSQTEK